MTSPDIARPAEPCAWEAYAPLHETAHAWIADALSNTRMKRL